MNNSFEKNGFVVLENVLNFDETEIIEIERYKNKYTNENFGKDGIVKIFNWEDTKISNFILNKITDIISAKINIDKKKLTESFSKKVYYTEDTLDTENRNQLPHFDSYPKLKAFVYLSDNSKSGSGSISFATGTHKSWFIQFIKFLRFFYIPGKHGVENVLFFKNIRKKLFFTEANGKKYSIVIFKTDTIHLAGKVKHADFTRKVIRFDFNTFKYPKSILKKVVN